MDVERREHTRYPSWLPATLWSDRTGGHTPVRVVDLSLGGAAIEGAFRDPLPGRLKLQIEWFGVVLTLECDAILWSLEELPPVVRLAFRNITNTQSLLLRNLLSTMTTDTATPAPPARAKRRWFRALAG